MEWESSLSECGHPPAQVCPQDGGNEPGPLVVCAGEKIDLPARSPRPPPLHCADRYSTRGKRTFAAATLLRLSRPSLTTSPDDFALHSHPLAPSQPPPTQGPDTPQHRARVRVQSQFPNRPWTAYPRHPPPARRAPRQTAMARAHPLPPPRPRQTVTQYHGTSRSTTTDASSS